MSMASASTKMLPTTNTLTNGSRTVIDTSKLRNMWETAYIVAFCDKFKSALRNLEFWPEEFEQTLYSSSTDELLEEIHCAFLTNVLNRKKAVERNTWRKFLTDTIEQHLKKRSDFCLDYNPMRRVNNYNYYELGVEDRVLILYSLVNWQLKESKSIRDLIDLHYKNRHKTEAMNPLRLEMIGQDRKNANYYFLGNSPRIYRERYPKPGIPITHENVEWIAVTTTLEEIISLVDDPNRLKPKSFTKDRALHAKLKEDIIPRVEELVQLKEKKEERRRKQERIAQRFAILHANATVYETRTRSASRKAGLNTPDGPVSIRNNELQNDYKYSPYPTASARRLGKRVMREESQAESVINNKSNTSTTDIIMQEAHEVQHTAEEFSTLSNTNGSVDFTYDSADNVPQKSLVSVTNRQTAVDHKTTNDEYTTYNAITPNGIEQGTNQHTNSTTISMPIQMNGAHDIAVAAATPSTSNSTSSIEISDDAGTEPMSIEQELFGKDSDTDLSDIWESSEESEWESEDESD
ncbi:4351_t:CDS:2 [Ambispora gerdemannii]|uniref:4351_t:CDS:1 n=1 Tax=Ambispora gerdemannii TaxID=144530 RepID=A0A9N9G8I1_9GLOM|nr:4351_t:CDS:2 [Ambispora gerdemannii]